MNKIAFVSTMYTAPWGGSEELWSRTASRMAQQGSTVYANVMDWPTRAKPLAQLEQAGVQITYRQEAKSIFAKVKKRMLKSQDYSWLDKVKPEFVLISDGMNFTCGGWMRACIERNLPFATVAHAAIETYFPDDSLVSQFGPCFEQAKATFFVSKGNLELTQRQFAASFANAQIVRNPYNVSYDAAPAWPEPDPVYKLACVARLDPGSKGQDILFDVLRADKWRNRPLEITLFGKGSSTNTLKALHKRYDLTNVFFGGFVDKVEDIWAKHHGLILPSRYEGLPISIVEAMLCGRFCIVTDVSGNPELLQDNVSGFLAAAPTAEFVDEALERAWQRRNEWREMGQIAAKQIRELVPSDPIQVFIEKLLISARK